MIRHILVPSNGLEANLLEDAFKPVSPFSAHVDVLHVGWKATREMIFYDNGFSRGTLDTMISEAQREAERFPKRPGINSIWPQPPLRSLSRPNPWALTV